MATEVIGRLEIGEERDRRCRPTVRFYRYHLDI